MGFKSKHEIGERHATPMARQLQYVRLISWLERSCDIDGKCNIDGKCDINGKCDIDEALFSQLLDLAEALIVCGADVNLVETSIVKLGKAYGAAATDAFVITSNISVTMHDENGHAISQIRRIHTAMSNNFDKLERLNALCTRCCNDRLTAGEIKCELAAITKAPLNRLTFYAGSVLAAGSFALFFGGTVLDAAVAAVFAVVICILTEVVKPYCPNEIVFNFIAALVTGLGICACVAVVPGLHGDMIIIGDIMLLIPGIAITNSMRDMLSGDTATGALRLLEALLWTGGLALGYMIPIALFGSRVDSGMQPVPMMQMICAMPASLGFALLFNLRPNLLVIASIGGLLTWAVFVACGYAMSGVFWPCLIASALATLYAEVLAHVFKAPISIFYIICEIPLIPGRGLYYTVSNCVQRDWEAMQGFGAMTAEYVVAIAFGVGVAWAITQIVHRVRERDVAGTIGT